MCLCKASTALLALLVAVYCHACSGHIDQEVSGTEFNRKLGLEMLDRQARTLKSPTTGTAQLYQQCGGKSPNGPEPHEDTCVLACEKGQCYRQNEWYWQCLPSDPCDTPGWSCRNDARCLSITAPSPPIYAPSYSPLPYYSPQPSYYIPSYYSPSPPSY